MAPRLRRLITRVALAPDTLERHLVVADLVGDAPSVLDVGGLPRRLETFLAGARVTTANVEAPADVLFDGVTLPFDDRSFDAATSVDVVEHLERPLRSAHVQELTRVARRRVVLSCPLGTDDHAAAERSLAEWHAATIGVRHRFLDEHVERGLPTEQELRELAPVGSAGLNLLFHGDFRRVERRFRLASLAKARRRPVDLARYGLDRFFGRPDAELHERPAPYTNRAFVVIDVRAL